MGLLNDIKTDVKKSGTNKKKFLYFKPGVKVRIRFLVDMDDGRKIKFHDSYTEGVNAPCQEIFDRECPNCGNDELRTRDQYEWDVWDYDNKEVVCLMAPVNSCSPVPQLVGFYESYGTLTDRDYVFTKSGTGTSGSFSVVPQDKAKFRNEKAKPFSDKKFYEILDKAFPCEGSDDDDDNDDDDDDKKKKSKKSDKKVKRYETPEDNNDDDIPDYGEMEPIDLYKLCKKRDIEAKPKQKKAYYIQLLKDDDSKTDDGWDDEDKDGEDEWDDE